MARPLPLASQRRKQQGNEYAGNVSSLPYRYTKKKKRGAKGAKRESFFFFGWVPFSWTSFSSLAAKLRLPLTYSLSYWLYLPPLYITEYARTTSTMGARQSGHLPPLRASSFAHFEQVHMCPHLPSCHPKGLNHYKSHITHTPSCAQGTWNAMRSTHLYSRESICVSQHTQQVPFLTWFHFDPSSDRSIENPAKHKQPTSSIRPTILAQWMETRKKRGTENKQTSIDGNSH